MKKFKITLINIGREKVCQEYEQEVGDLDEIVNLTFDKVKRFLLSSHACFGRLKQRISFLLKDNEATELEIEQVYNHILMELI